MNFNGETIAEKDQTGALTDYIFAGGKRIAKVAPVRVLHHFGVCGNCIGGASNFQIPALASNLGGYSIRSGDRLVFSQKQTNARAGLYLFATDGTNSIGSLTDQNGDWINSSSVADGTWHTRVVSLNGWAGKTIGTNLGVSVEGNTPTGVNWDSQIADIALVSVDGTVNTLFNQQNVSASTGNSSSGSNFAILTSTDTVSETHFYLGDHLGTVQMEFAQGGWPVWQGQFAPFGGELDSQSTPNHYKFTGKERDTESGLDYFGARYYASNMGRFISPDWSARPTAVPYADLKDPQTLNLYIYGGNNPLTGLDPDGHCDWCQKLWNGITGKGFQTNAQINAAQPTTVSAHDSGLTPIANPGSGIAGNSINGASAAGWGLTFGLTMSELDQGPQAMEEGDEEGAAAVGASALTAPNSKAATYEDGLAAAQEAYPNKAGSIEEHHVDPKYLGGAADGTTVPIDAAYHQQITNAFRKEAPYGSGPVSAERLQQIKDKVYSQYPLPESPK